MISRKAKEMTSSKENLDTNQDLSYSILSGGNRISPTFEALKISFVYTLLGVLWILLSDKLLLIAVSDDGLRDQFQLYKGWFYVAATAVIFYFIINRKINIIKNSTDRIVESYNELTLNQKKLHELAYYDPLTRLPNRTMFEEESKKRMLEAEQNNKNLTFLFVDADHFKNINDVFGNIAGDKLLIDLAKMLSSFIEKQDYLARMGGDEFGLIFNDIDGLSSVLVKTQSMIDSINRIWSYDGIEFHVTISVGIANYPEHGRTYDTLMKCADIALYYAKENGRSQYAFYTDTMIEKTLQHIQLSSILNAALSNESFMLYYQPLVDVETGSIIGVEALIRLYDKDGKFIPPMDFIPFAEKSEFIHRINEWVIRSVCIQKKLWNDSGIIINKIMVNLSGKSVSQPGIFHDIKKIMNEFNILPHEIEFEITETAAIDNLEKTIELISHLKESGISISLDDFGIGYSSLTYLQKLPIDVLKIDRKFIMNVQCENEEEFIFKTVVDLAHSLGLKVVAEGIETKEQLAFIKKHHCDIAQGFYLYKPLPSGQVTELLKIRNK